jgi:phosphatidylserine synthase
LASLAIVRGSGVARLLGLDATMFQTTIEIWVTLGALVVALLMVSRVPYPHVTKQMLRGRRHFSHLVEIILVGFIVYLAPELALVLLFWGYALSMPIRYQVVRSLRHETRQAPAPIEKHLPQ